MLATAHSPRAFLGGRGNPLLAPRGVHLAGGHLFVADTGQNRVFIWKELPTAEQQEADVVLGQGEKQNTERNAGGTVTASSLMYPSGLWSDGRRLIVCDAWNHRVLIWNELPTRNGQPADVVIGQPDFTHNEPNVGGIGTPPGARSLHWPYGVESDGERLLIADTGNRRVLVFDRIPEENYTAADRVLGQADFSQREYDPKHAIWPYSIKLGPNGELAVTDTQYYRTLLYPPNSYAKGLTAVPVIIGQTELDQSGQNQYRWSPEAFTLNWCYDSCFYGGGLFVADTGNSRVLYFRELPTRNNQSANSVLGQADFKLGIENRNSIHATPESLYWPFHLAIEDGTLAIADTGNHRIVLYTLNSPPA